MIATAAGLAGLAASGLVAASTAPAAAEPVAGVTGECRAQVALGRNAGDNMRFRVLDRAAGAFVPLLPDGGGGWGDSRGTTALAWGDADGDGDAELALGRNAGGGMRFEVQDLVAGAWVPVFDGGSGGWGGSRATTALAWGDADGDGDDELAVGRNAGTGMRFVVWDLAGGAWSPLLSGGGAGWGDSRSVSALAWGDVDGDGDDELAVGRNAGANMRYEVLDLVDDVWQTVLEDGGSGWGDSRATTALALGDVDGDGDDELAVGRNAGDNMRFEVLDSAEGTWAQLFQDGAGWGPSRGVSALAMGDVDGDGDDELALGRNAGSFMRYRVLDLDPAPDDPAQPFRELLGEGGRPWGASRSVTALAIGDVDGDGDGELALGRNAGGGVRLEVLDYRPHADEDAGEEEWPLLLEDGAGWGDSRSVTALAVPDTLADTDDDGLLDCWETQGYDADADGAVDVALPGSDPLRKDLYLELDVLLGESPFHRHCLGADALADVLESFAAAPVGNPDGTSGVQLHIDVPVTCGTEVVVELGAVTGTAGFLGGGDTILETGREVIDFDGAAGDPAANFYDLKDVFFDPDRARIYRYGISGHQTNLRKPADDCTSGWAPEGPGNDMIITLGGVDENGFPCGAVDPVSGESVGSRDDQAGTLQHELGHLLGLSHGGLDDRTNYKPNYLSVMNYLFSECSVPPSPAPGIVGGCDYSRLALPPPDGTGLPALDETSLDECAGIDGGTLGYGPFDWNGDGVLSGTTCPAPDTTNVSADLNEDRFCVDPGPDGVLDTSSAGDDVVEVDQVADGPDRTCDTGPSGDDVAARDVGAVQVATLVGKEDWSAVSYRFAHLSSFLDAEPPEDDPSTVPTEAAEVRAALLTRVAPELELTAVARPLAAGRVVVDVAVANRGGGPALGAALGVTAPGGAGDRFELGALPAAAESIRTVTVRADGACETGRVDVVVTGTDFFGGSRRWTTSAEVALPPGC